MKHLLLLNADVVTMCAIDRKPSTKCWLFNARIDAVITFGCVAIKLELVDWFPRRKPVDFLLLHDHWRILAIACLTPTSGTVKKT